MKCFDYYPAAFNFSGYDPV